MSTTPVSSGSSTTGSVVTSGNTLKVLSGGSTLSAMISSGGKEVVSGFTSETFISFGGRENVFGSSLDTQILGGGTETVFAGGSATSAVVSAGGDQHLASGGLSIETLVLAGGSQTITGGSTAYGTTVNSGGIQVVASGATAFDALISSGGIQEVNTASTIYDTTLLTGASILIKNLGYNTHETAFLNSSTDVLTITDGAKSDNIQLSGDYTGWTFDVSKDGGTLVTAVACYCRGTRILTDRGEVAVESLAIGDRLVTLSGALAPLKWIGRRSYAGWLAEGNPDVQPIRFKAGALGDNQPSRDLFVSPEHAMYLDGALIPAKLLVNGVTIAPADAMEEVEYFHLELPEHAVIFAEGALSESFVDDDSRGMFHNAHEFHALYPNAPRGGEAEYCAPRVEDGFALEAARQKLMSRAVRLRPDGSVAELPVLTGSLDRVSRHGVEGWAYEPEGPVALAVLDNGVVIGRFTADIYDAKLEAAGIGDGKYAFRFALPNGFSDSVDHRVEVRRVSDWTLLPGAPAVLKAETFAPGSYFADPVLLAAE